MSVGFSRSLLRSRPNGHRRRAGVTVALGLSAGAVGWSGMANATVEESAFQVLLLPEYYELMDNGVVVFKLEAGENFSLTSDQYLILEDGLLLITDELAQASISTHPVVGSVRAQLMSDVQPVRSPDGSVIQASDDSPLWSGVGPAPRLSEQVELQRYEVAQAIDGSSNEVGEAIAVGLLSPGAIALLGVFVTNDQPESETQVEETPAPPALPPEPEFLSNAMFQALTPTNARAFTGSAGDSFIGYTAASTSATTSALTNVGRGFENAATFDMSAGGDNYFVAAGYAAYSSGSIAYTGSSGDDSLTFGGGPARNSGSARFDMSLGGNNTFEALDYGAEDGGVLSYAGGSGDDSLTFEDELASVSGSATFDMFRGGNNTFEAGDTAANSHGSIAYIGGSGDDSLTFGADLAAFNGTATFDMSRGGNNTLVAGTAAARAEGLLSYIGGPGGDSLTFGDYLAANDGNANLDLGDDTAADTITFPGIADGETSISNFDPTDGDTIVLQLFNDTADVTLSPSGGGSDTQVSASGIAFVLTGITTGSLALTTNTDGYVVITDVI